MSKCERCGWCEAAEGKSICLTCNAGVFTRDPSEPIQISREAADKMDAAAERALNRLKEGRENRRFDPIQLLREVVTQYWDHRNEMSPHPCICACNDCSNLIRKIEQVLEARESDNAES